jgi:hypothetical protein
MRRGAKPWPEWAVLLVLLLVLLGAGGPPERAVTPDVAAERELVERHGPTSSSVGACFSRTAGYPAGAYWVVVVFYFPVK